MESEQSPQQQDQQQQSNPNEDGGGGSSKSNFLCSRVSSTRWTPTTDQIRILKDLYYNYGVRSPSADQIQRISARLRQYGKIEGKNVFYWFQNHKAREKQKKRFSTEIPVQISVANGCWRSDDPIFNNKFPIVTPIPGIPSSSSSSSSSSSGMIAVGQMGNYGYGSGTMETSFRHCSISTGCTSGGSIDHNIWDGVDPYLPSYPFLDKRKAREGIPEQEGQRGLETLPLFPMHGDEISGFCHVTSESNSHNWYHSDDGNANSRTSLELSLNSYVARPSDSS